MNNLTHYLGLRAAFVLLLSLAAGAGTSSASVLNWSDPGVTYTPGSLSQTFTDVDGSGVDIVITFSGDTSILSGATPEINTTLTGGQPPGSQENLFMSINPGNLIDSVTITTEFLKTGTPDAVQVLNVSYTIFDIDRSGGSSWQDEVLNFQATDTVAGGSAFGPTVTPVNAANVTVTGSGTSISALGVASVGNTSDQANVGVDFGTSLLTEFSFEYKHDIRTGSPSGIGLYNIQFSVVPEPEVWFAACGLCLFVFIGALKRLRQVGESTEELAEANS